MVRLVETIALNESKNITEDMHTINILKEENNILIKYLEDHKVFLKIIGKNL